jgi:4-amino-4-deoxy-L-arabinose transferase-like glycosyltransferase
MATSALPFLVLLAGIVVLAGLRPSPRRTPDELSYTLFSAVVRERGAGQIAELVRQYNAHPELADSPSPTRVGHVWIGATVMRITGSITLENLILASTLAAVLSLALVCGIGLSTLGPWVAAIATLFLATSPLALAVARRGWGDGIIGLMALAMVWAVIQSARRPAARRWPLLFFAFAWYGILVKETGLVLLALGTLALAILAWRRSRGVMAPAVMLGGGVVALLISVAVLAATCGGLAPLRATLARTAAAAATNDFMRTYQTGSPLYYAIGLAVSDPVPFALGYLGAILVALGVPFVRRSWSEDHRWAALTMLAWFVILVTLLACSWPQKNLRFLSVIYGAVDLLAAAFVWCALAALRSRLSPKLFRITAGLTAGLLVFSAWRSLLRFDELFVRRDILDLVTPWLTGQR